jgi:selenocysteine lyase/cysteine desulfurase
MVALGVPPGVDGGALARRLRTEFLIEVAVQRDLLRVSFQGYNDDDDLERLLAALRAVL